MSLPVVILAGGLATRLRPISERIPKVLVDVEGRPFAEHQLELLYQHGIRQAVFCIGHLGEQVEAALGDGSRWGMELRYSFDGPTLMGTGGALRRALPLLGEEFLVLYGDAYLQCDYQAAAQAFVQSGKLGLMTVFHNDNQWDHSNVIFTDGQILRYDKQQRTPEMHHIDYGLGALRAEVFTRYPADQPIDLAIIYQDLLAHEQLAGFEVNQRFYEVGSHTGLEETRRYFAQRQGFRC
ncbi:MAG: nucleotidyltransferase family protein [Chloroflexales bacterium]